MFDDVHLVADDGRAVAVFSAGAERRAALADALSWELNRRFQVEGLDTDAALELRSAGALADQLDEFRGLEGLSPVRLNGDQARLLIGAAWAYLAERDTETYQPPEERARIAELGQIVEPLFDLITQLDRADDVLGASSI